MHNLKAEDWARETSPGEDCRREAWADNTTVTLVWVFVLLNYASVRIGISELLICFMQTVMDTELDTEDLLFALYPAMEIALQRALHCFTCIFKIKVLYTFILKNSSLDTSQI